jgi:hypothetical protein
MGFIEDLVFMIVKGNMFLSIVENPWFKWMVLCLCGQVKFLFQEQLICEHIPTVP